MSFWWTMPTLGRQGANSEQKAGLRPMTVPYNVYYYCRLAILPHSGTLLGSYNLAEHLP